MIYMTINDTSYQEMHYYESAKLIQIISGIVENIKARNTVETEPEFSVTRE